MDTVTRYALLTVSLVLLMVTALSPEEPPQPRKYPSYCIEPFDTYDTGQKTYTDCRLVPMWSMKV